MRYLSLILFLSLSFLFYACQPDDLSAPENQSIETAPEFYIAQAEEMVAETEAQVLEHPNYVAADNERRRAVMVPAGSTNALEAAIQAAGPFGTVIMQTGLHTENQTVTIDQTVRIIGEDGAIIQSGAAPSVNPSVFPIPVNPAIFVKNAPYTQIRNLTIVPDLAALPNSPTKFGEIAIIVSESDHAYLAKNVIKEFGGAIWTSESEYVVIKNNEFVGIFSEAPPIFSNTGVFIFSGDFARVSRNTFSDFDVSAFVCDANGLLFRNSAQAESFGYILCKWPDNVYQFPDGTVASANTSAIDWLTVGNESGGAAFASYYITDGATENLLVNNQSSNAALYDFWFTGDITDPFIGLLPATFDNTYIQGFYRNQVVKDCGVDNRILGGSLVDTSVDNCP